MLPNEEKVLLPAGISKSAAHTVLHIHTFDSRSWKVVAGRLTKLKRAA
jgi:hypothetical protein